MCLEVYGKIKILVEIQIYRVSAWADLYSQLNEKYNTSGTYGKCSDGVPSIHFFQAEHRIHFRSRPMRFLGFSSHKKGAPRQETSKWSTVWNKFSRSGWSVVRNASLAKGGTSKKRPSPHLHKVLTRSNKVSPRTLQTALVKNCNFARCIVWVRNFISHFEGGT
jgi:hypothetical protein